MKYRMICLCLCIVLLLAGCQFVPDEYISVAPHTDSHSQPNEEEEKEAATVTNFTDLKNTIFTYVMDGAEEVVLTSNAYTGNIHADFDKAKDYITKENPSSAYLVQNIEAEITPPTGSYFRLTLKINYQDTHTSAELRAAPTVRAPADVESAIKSALEEHNTKLLMQVSGFEPMDFQEMVNQCFENNLTTIMAKPQVEVKVYPDSGILRIIELQFTYPRDVAELNVMKSMVETIMTAAYSYVSYGQSELEKAMLLYSFLSERHEYIESTSDYPAHSLLCEGMADSRIFAAVYSAMCTQAGLHSTVVHGVKDGIPYDWNILELDSGIWHVDTFANELNGLREMQLLTDEQMYGYEWEREAYPVCVGAPEPPPVEEVQAPVPEETLPEAPEDPNEVTPPPAEENNPPDEPLPPEENSGDGDIPS